MGERTLDHSLNTNETDTRNEVRSGLLETAEQGLQDSRMETVMASAVDIAALQPINDSPASADAFTKQWEDSLAA